MKIIKLFFNRTSLYLDNSDLHFKVFEDGFSGCGVTKQELCYLWAGCRATHGVTGGKHFFECRVKRYGQLSSIVQ